MSAFGVNESSSSGVAKVGSEDAEKEEEPSDGIARSGVIPHANDSMRVILVPGERSWQDCPGENHGRETHDSVVRHSKAAQRRAETVSDDVRLVASGPLVHVIAEITHRHFDARRSCFEIGNAEQAQRKQYQGDDGVPHRWCLGVPEEVRCKDSAGECCAGKREERRVEYCFQFSVPFVFMVIDGFAAEVGVEYWHDKAIPASGRIHPVDEDHDISCHEPALL